MGGLTLQHSFEAYADPNAWAMAAALALVRDVENALLRKEEALVAIAGGRTPPPILQHFVSAPLPWRRVRFTPTDDRDVPDDHPARNGALIKTWLAEAIETGAGYTPIEALEHCPDIVLLGFGADRHIASLFPAGDGMRHARSMDTETIVAPVTPAPLPDNAPFSRRTLTLAAITSAPRIVLAASGLDKWCALEEARGDPNQTTPLAELIAQNHASVSAFVLVSEV